jgi:hypothetical protein
VAVVLIWAIEVLYGSEETSKIVINRMGSYVKKKGEYNRFPDL